MSLWNLTLYIIFERQALVFCWALSIESIKISKHDWLGCKHIPDQRLTRSVLANEIYSFPKTKTLRENEYSNQLWHHNGSTTIKDTLSPWIHLRKVMLLSWPWTLCILKKIKLPPEGFQTQEGGRKFFFYFSNWN